VREREPTFKRVRRKEGSFRTDKYQISSIHRGIYNFNSYEDISKKGDPFKINYSN